MRALMLAIGGVIVGALAVSPWVVLRAAAPLGSWEHTCITGSTATNRPDTALAQLKTEANTLGQQGWEMVGVATPPDRVLMCFKRQTVGK